jgi:serine protease Do
MMMLPTNNGSHRKPLSARRLTLLGSVAVVGAALAFGGAGNGSFTQPARAASTQTQQQGPAGFADLIAKVKPAVISVKVKVDRTADASMGPQMDEDEGMPPGMQGSPFEKFFRRYGENGPRGQMPRHEMVTGVGSGFFISADGYAVTNNHVVDHASSVEVTTDDGKTYTAKVIGTDPKTDLALIKVDGKSDFAYANFATDASRVGDWVVAVGNPYGLGGTVTAGIVSAQGRDIGSGAYDYMQIDAPINKGNSGGPTFDTNGDVVGVNTAIYSPTGGSVGIGFDIPAATAKMVVAQLKDKGAVTRSWLGVQVQAVTSDIANSLGMKTASGALVAEAKPDTPAAKAGIQAGDVITAVNGNTIKDSRTLAREISAMVPGSSVKLDILRNGEAKNLTVTLANMPNQPEKQANAGENDRGTEPGTPRLGLSVAPAGDVAGAGDKGVVITAVDPDGAAAGRGLKSGDVILEAAGKSVGSVGDLRSALKDAKSGGKKDVLLRVKSADNTRFVAVPIG